MFFTLETPSETKPDIVRLIDEYSKSLTRLCYMILKDVHLAEDAAWETIYKAYKNYSSFRKESNEKTWITRIAINVCKNYMRKSSHKKFVSSDCVPLSYASEDELTVEFRDDESLALLNAVYNLPGKYRQVILLHYYAQMSVSEISDLLHEFENTISVRLNRAHAQLKKSLMEGDSDEKH